MCITLRGRGPEGGLLRAQPMGLMRATFDVPSASAHIGLLGKPLTCDAELSDNLEGCAY